MAETGFHSLLVLHAYSLCEAIFNINNWISYSLLFVALSYNLFSRQVIFLSGVCFNNHMVMKHILEFVFVDDEIKNAFKAFPKSLCCLSFCLSRIQMHHWNLFLRKSEINHTHYIKKECG